MIEALGKYEIRRELARGAMGVVYEGYDPLIKRRVALKTIRPDQLDGEKTSDMIARFRREAQAAGRLSHPNIVAIYDFGDDGGTWFIAMEYVDGRDLRECFAADERFRLPDIERIMTQILAALDYSHRQGVVHRDIKPANIFLLADATVKVADFGIAHLESSNLTQVGTVVGTPNYMSPEQIMGLPVDGRTDLFAAGVILYQFLTGERPFAGSTTTTMQKVLKEEPLSPSTLNVQLPPAIDTVVRKALAKRADDRFQSAQEFADALHAALRTGVAASGTITMGSDADATVPNLPRVEPDARSAPNAVVGVAASARQSAQPTPFPSPPPVRAPSQRAAIAIVAAIVVIGIGAVITAWKLMPHDSTARVANAGSSASQPASAKPAAAPSPAGPVAASATPPATVAAALRPGMLVISAVGLADPSGPRYASDPSLLQADARADAQSQLVSKALMLLLDRKSIAANYDVLQSRVLSQSGNYLGSIVHQSEPQIGKDGLMAVTTQAVVDVAAVRKDLDRMSRDERMQLIRANGDPRIAVRITVRDADAPNAPAKPSPVAENILEERIRAFGFRTWSEDGDAKGGHNADFLVTGEATVRKLSTRLAASGLVITKYALASWTVKCADRASGEDIYFNTTLPKANGSSASEEEALRTIGAKVADQFSRDFFLSHVPIRGRKITLRITGLPESATDALIVQELIGLPGVMTVNASAAAQPRSYELEMAGNGGDVISADVVAPLNAKLGAACLSVTGSEGDRVTVAFDARCAEGLRARLETNPPAGLYSAPPERQKSVIKNPETLRKLMV